jgi:hypothetical protein
MAKMELPKQASAAPSKAPRVLTTRVLDVFRHGNDDYSTTELTLSGDGITWRTTSAKVLKEHASRNVTSAIVEEWHRELVGLDFMGSTGL